MDLFTGVAVARAEALHKRIEEQRDQASIRYVFAPIFDMIVQPLATTIAKGRITPISEQGQPVGEVYLMTLVRDGEMLNPSQYKLSNGVGEIPINPAPIVDALLDTYGLQGAVQIKSLFNLGVAEFLGYALNETIFGDGEYSTAQAYFDRFAEVRKKASMTPVLDRVLFELDASVNMAFAWAKMKAEQSNQMLKAGEIKRFSPFENKLFKFTGVTAIDEAMNQVATNQAALAETLPKVVTEFNEAVIASRPDYAELGAAIAQGVKDGVKEIFANQPQPASAKEEPPKLAATKGGKG